MRDYVRSSIAALYPAMVFGPNKDRRAEARRFLKEVEMEMGPLTIRERLFCWATLPLSLWTWLAAKLDIFQQPKLLRIEHRLAKRIQAKAQSDKSISGYPHLLVEPGIRMTVPRPVREHEPGLESGTREPVFLNRRDQRSHHEHDHQHC